MLLPAAVVTATDISTWLDVLLHVQNTSPFCVWMLTTFNGPFVFSCLFWYLGVRYMDLPVVLSVTYHLVLILYTIVTMKNTPRTAPIQENIIVFWVEERSVEGGVVIGNGAGRQTAWQEAALIMARHLDIQCFQAGTVSCMWPPVSSRLVDRLALPILPPEEADEMQWLNDAMTVFNGFRHDNDDATHSL